jgi:hypothetical protein
MEHLLDDLTKNIKTIIVSGQDNIDVLNETKALAFKDFCSFFCQGSHQFHYLTLCAITCLL